MPTLKFTAKVIQGLGLPEGKAEGLFFDSDIGGFGLRLRAGGSKTWIFQYKLGSKQRRMSFGTYPTMGLEHARRTAAELQAKARLGQDPAGEKIEARARSAETFHTAAKQYLEWQEKRLRPRSFEEVERHLLTHSRPLHGEPLAKIDRRAVAGLLSALPANGNHVRASLSAFFAWAMREGLAEANPAALTNKPAETTARARTLSADELRDVWRVLEADDYGAIVRLLALTGARREEIGSLTWPEVDLEAALIRLPGERTKNGRPFDLPLSAPAAAILRGRDRDEERDFVFGRGKGGFSGWSACKARLDKRIADLRKEEGRAPMPPWVMHDLRRTMSTVMHETLGVQPHIVEACLNHVSGHQGGVAGVYNRSQYSEEKRAALDLWGRHIVTIVEGRNVTRTG
jgi:integrase